MIDLDTLQALYDAATPGEWRAARSTTALLNAYSSYTYGGIGVLYKMVGGSPRVLGGDFDNVEDARFAAAVHSAFPQLLSEITETRASLATAAARVEVLEQQLDRAEREVSKMHRITEGPDEHRKDCPWWYGSGCWCFEYEERERLAALAREGQGDG